MISRGDRGFLTLNLPPLVATKGGADNVENMETGTMMQGDELRAIRKGLGMSQATFAKALGLSEAFIGMMERGVKDIEPRTAFGAQLLLRNQFHPWGNWRLDLKEGKLAYVDPVTGKRNRMFDIDYRARREDGEKLMQELLTQGLPETQGFRMRLALIENEEFKAFSDYRV
jgi:transcriptional regulator with XRE-family HTH domain